MQLGGARVKGRRGTEDTSVLGITERGLGKEELTALSVDIRNQVVEASSKFPIYMGSTLLMVSVCATEDGNITIHTASLGDSVAFAAIKSSDGQIKQLVLLNEIDSADNLGSLQHVLDNGGKLDIKGRSLTTHYKYAPIWAGLGDYNIPGIKRDPHLTTRAFKLEDGDSLIVVAASDGAIKPLPDDIIRAANTIKKGDTAEVEQIAEKISLYSRNRTGDEATCLIAVIGMERENALLAVFDGHESHYEENIVSKTAAAIVEERIKQGNFSAQSSLTDKAKSQENSRFRNYGIMNKISGVIARLKASLLGHKIASGEIKYRDTPEGEIPTRYEASKVRPTEREITVVEEHQPEPPQTSFPYRNQGKGLAPGK